MAENKKAGPVTLALGLIFFGFGLLMFNFFGPGILAAALKYWPVLLIGLGAEYFTRSYLNRKNNPDAGTRFHLPTVFIILLAAVIGYAGQQAAGLYKNQELGGFISEAIAGGNFDYQYNFESKPLVVKPGVTKVKIDAMQGRIDLAPSQDGKLQVRARIIAWGPSEEEAKKRAEAVKINVDEGEVIGISRAPEGNHNLRRHPVVSYRIMVPKGITIVTEKTAGDIKADNLEANLEIKDFTGDSNITGIIGNVALDGEYGQINFREIDGNVEIRTVSGEINIKDVTQNIQVANDHGRIEIAGTRPVSGNYSINTKNGDIMLRIPAASDATVLARTENGAINGTLNLKMEKLKENNTQHPALDEETTGSTAHTAGAKGIVKLSSGKGAINLSTENGNITVDKY